MKTNKEKTIIEALLSNWPTVSSSKKAFVGLDGYVDKIQHPVQYQKADQSVYFPSLDQFGQRIKDAAGKSAQIELFTQAIKLGGNAPILANALASLDIPNYCLGTMGYPSVNPVFQSMHPKCQVISIGKAAETNALEFGDGKLILSELSTFTNLDWQKVKSLLDLNDLIEKIKEVNLIAMVGWCNLPYATDLWQGFLTEVVENNVHQNPHFLFDIADPSKKSDEEIAEILRLAENYAKLGTLTLGLNENEAIKLYHSICRLNKIEAVQSNINDIGQFIYNHSNIQQLLIHPIDACYIFTPNNIHYLKGRVVKKPIVSTGGGDNFNAGFYFGLLNDFSFDASMILAMATSGAYVQSGRSPSKKHLRQYLEDWYAEL